MKFKTILDLVMYLVSPPSRGAWIEISPRGPTLTRSQSPPSRGAWIEIIVDQVSVADLSVAPLAGGVD